QELRGAGVAVSVVLPATVDTPIYQHAANRTGREIHAMPPVVAPERVARAIVRRAGRPGRTVRVGAVQGSGITLKRVLPRLYDAIIVAAMNRLGLRDPGAPDHDGTVYAPHPASNSVHGGWRAGASAQQPRGPA